DLGRLLAHFLEAELEGLSGDAAGPAAQPSAALISRLARHDWPGNVRQLRNVARRLAATLQAGSSRPLSAEKIDSLLGAPAAEGPRDPGPHEASGAAAAREAKPRAGGWRRAYRRASDISEEELIAALREAAWEPKPAAEALGLSRTVLYDLIEACPRVRTAARLGAEEINAAVTRSGGDLHRAGAELEVSARGLKMRMKALGLR
ncbi:MAG: sigma-54-dependent Fis family transcriptional regulator, partial [Acidobacteriota bacterium]